MKKGIEALANESASKTAKMVLVRHLWMANTAMEMALNVNAKKASPMVKKKLSAAQDAIKMAIAELNVIANLV